MLDLALTISAFDNASRVFESIANNARAMQNSLGAIGAASIAGQQQMVQATSQQAAAVGESMVKMGAVGTLAGRPVMKAFTELEDSATRLQSVMMDKTGKVSQNFQTLDMQARDLGNRLPGMTADFYDLATAMLSLGMSQETLLNGGLKSASYLGVLTRGFGEGYKEAGTAVAKFKESLGVADVDMIKFMDTVQRLRHLGMPLTDMRYAFARLGGEMKSLGLQGLTAANDIAPLAAYIYKTGSSGQITGSSLNQLMRQLAMMPLIESKRLFQNQAQPILQNYGIKLQFVNEQGQFLGIQNMVAQMDKLKKLTALERSLVINAMVGSGGDANAMKFLINMGVTGYDQMKSQLANQADLSTRVESVLKTQTNTWDALEGTVKNTLAVLGGGMAPALKNVMNYLNGMAAGLGDWLAAHPRFVTALATGAFALTSFLVVAGGASFVLGKTVPFLLNFGGQLAGIARGAISAAGGISSLTQFMFHYTGAAARAQQFGNFLAGTRAVSAVQTGGAGIAQGATAMASGMLRMPFSPSAGFSAISGGFMSVIRSVGTMNIALLASPAFWVISAIAIGALLIIRNWQTVSAFFRGMGEGLRSAFAAPWAALQGLRAAFAPIMPILSGVFRAIMSIFAPTQATAQQLQRAGSMGAMAGQLIGTAMRIAATPIIWVLTLVGHLLTFIIRTATGGNILGRVIVSAFTLMVSPILTVWKLINSFFAGVMALFDGKTWKEAGQIAVDSLWNGMLEMFGKILDGVKSVADKVMGFFGMGKKEGGNAAQTAAQSAQTAQKAATQPPPPPPAPPPAPPKPAVQQQPRLVVSPSRTTPSQISEAASSPAMMPSEISALQSEQIASSIMDIPSVSYQPPKMPKTPKTPRPALMSGRYESGTLLAPSVPHEFEGQTYYSTPIDMGTTRNPNRKPRAKAASQSSTKEESTSAAPQQTTNNAPFTFNFSFNFAGAEPEGIRKEVQRAIEDKIGDIERAVRDSINSTRLGFSL